MIIGVTGKFGTGKTTLAKYLADKKGFVHLQARTVIEEFMRMQEGKIEFSREALRVYGNKIRDKYGPNYIAKELIQRARSLSEKSLKAVIESIRTPAEVDELRRRGGYLIAVIAKDKIRFDRLCLRKDYASKFKTVEEMLKAEKLEMKSTDPTKQNLSRCTEIADFEVTNNGKERELFSQIENILLVIRDKEGSRPNKERLN